MKQYLSIPKESNTCTSVYVFDKLDGSNIRAEWNNKRGFYKFGSRKRLIDSQTKFLGEAIGIISSDFAYVDSWLKNKGVKQAICYFEFYGDNSFAGQHVEEPHGCVLLDIELANNGFISPDVIVNEFEGRVPLPKTIFADRMLTDEDVKAIVSGQTPGITFEGVVCKAKKQSEKSFHLTMFKIKTQKWIDKVKSLYKDPDILNDLI